MTISLSTAYVRELQKGSNSPNTIIEIQADKTLKYGYSDAAMPDVIPALDDVSSLQNKIDTKSGVTTLGRLTFKIVGRDVIRFLIKDRFLKNRRITRYDGFVASGFNYADYAATFKGKIIDWSRDGDELTITAADDLFDTKTKLPVENARKTQTLAYQNINPVNVMLDMLSTQLAIDSTYVNTTAFQAERDLWLGTLRYDRVLTKPEETKKYLAELQVETNSFIVHEGDKISFKFFGPAVPNQNVESWTDSQHLLDNSFSLESGYDDALFNRIIVYYDYDESGSDGQENYESIYITQDSSSLSTSEWAETRTKEIKSKWIRTKTYTQPSNITGVTLYHVSFDNSTGNGLLRYDSTAAALRWAAPGSTSTLGAWVEINKAGQFRLFDSDTSKSVRVVVESSSLPVASQDDTISITSLNGNVFAQTLADRLLARYRDPVASFKCKIDINNSAWQNTFIKPTDLKLITTDEAFTKASSSWNQEQIMITSVRPDNKDSVMIEGVQTKLYRKYGFIAPAGFPEYTSASMAQKQYAFISDSSAKLDNSTANAYYIW